MTKEKSPTRVGLFDYMRVNIYFFSLYKSHAILVGEVYKVLFEQQAESLFKVLLAAHKLHSYFFGRRRVGDIHYAAVIAQERQYAVGHLLHAVLFAGVKRDINFSIGANSLDICFVFFAYIDVAEYLIVVNHSPKQVVDNNFKTQLCALSNEYVHLVVWFEVRLLVVEKLVEFCRANNPI